MRDTTLTATAVRERGLLDQAGMTASRQRARLFARARSAQGFSLIELLVVVSMIGILAAIGIGVTGGMVNTSKGQSGASQVSSALRRAREMSISRRRNIQVTFQGTNQLVLQQINVNAANPPPETITLEGRIQYTRFAGIADTPELFGNVAAVEIAGPLPAMFTSEGMFADGNGDPTNATIRIGIPSQPSTANAITILGATATIRQYRWDGRIWVE